MCRIEGKVEAGRPVGDYCNISRATKGNIIQSFCFFPNSHPSSLTTLPYHASRKHGHQIEISFYSHKFHNLIAPALHSITMEDEAFLLSQTSPSNYTEELTFLTFIRLFYFF